MGNEPEIDAGAESFAVIAVDAAAVILRAVSTLATSSATERNAAEPPSSNSSTEPIGLDKAAPKSAMLHSEVRLSDRNRTGTPPILDAKDYAAPSVFRPENLLREARRQKDVSDEKVPEICVLDPDGDLVRQLRAQGRASPHAGWACYHTDLYAFEHEGERFGIVGCAVGASFAVLVAEQLFASGCRLVVSITSSGQLVVSGPTPYFILIERALRDEGTSYHYLPPSAFAEADPRLIDIAAAAFEGGSITMVRGATWTTDAPFRETNSAIDAARRHGALAVEMEAAALYAFAQARKQPVLCFAHVTNQMAQIEGDFEKGEANGAGEALAVIAVTARAWYASRSTTGGDAL